MFNNNIDVVIFQLLLLVKKKSFFILKIIVLSVITIDISTSVQHLTHMALFFICILCEYNILEKIVYQPYLYIVNY